MRIILLLSKKSLERIFNSLSLIGCVLNNISLSQKIIKILGREKKLILVTKINDVRYLNKIIIPPVNNKITAYIIQDLILFRRIIPVSTLRMINHEIKKVGLGINIQSINPLNRKNR